MEQSLIHTLFPLSIVYMLCKYGWVRTRNQQLLPCSWSGSISFLFFNVIGLLPSVIVVGGAIRGGAYTIELVMLAVIFVLRFMVVAVKVRSRPRLRRRRGSVGAALTLAVRSTASWPRRSARPSSPATTILR